MFDKIRKFLNNNPLVVALVLIVAIAAGGAAIWYAGVGSANTKTTRLYYTMDDGKSWYTGAAQGAPFTKDGKTVVEAIIFSCADGKEFVGYLRRFEPKYQQAATNSFTRRDAGRLPPDEIKRPGDTEWVAQGTAAAANVPGGSSSAAKYNQIKQVKCPDGKYAILHIAQ